MRNSTQQERYLRSSCKISAPASPLLAPQSTQASPDGQQMLQIVELKGGYPEFPEASKKLVEVHLSKEDDCWKIDAMILVP